MNVVFLDYDGVVNTPMWDKDGKNCRFFHPKDNKVNNFQAIQWVSEFCQRYNYNIVVTSAWRLSDNYIECLKNGGLRESIKVVGKTPSIRDKCRGYEIQKYIDEHTDIEQFLIFDDEGDLGDCMGMRSHLVECNSSTGFGEDEFYKALSLHNHFKK